MENKKTKNTILGLRAQTSIHAGTGRNTGVIDLPIQREAHTDWPCVYGSAMKGALRAHAELRGKWKDSDVCGIFGADDASSASKIAITDGRLLLLPVRCLTGHFRWVTCPAVLERLKRDLAMIDKEDGADFDIPQPDAGKVVAKRGNTSLFLEEFKFEQVEGKVTDILAMLAKFGIEIGLLEEQLVLMHNDDFADFCRTATAITPHISIDNKTKTVKSGQLWYEESLPPDSLLYTLLMGTDKAVSDVSSLLTDNYVQIGGNETVGMGWCKVSEVKV